VYDAGAADVAKFSSSSLTGLHRGSRFARIMVMNRGGLQSWLGVDGSAAENPVGYLGMEAHTDPASVAISWLKNGNVGIGTVSPGGKLDVNGTIYQRGSVLHADYVFEPDYELESIEEHAEYMWQNKHLKAIPKTQIDESGQQMLEIGAHRRGILEELEKAHVYIHGLNERIKVLEAKIGALEE